MEPDTVEPLTLESLERRVANLERDVQRTSERHPWLRVVGIGGPLMAEIMEEAERHREKDREEGRTRADDGA
jgi:hypothetical protein